MATNGDILMSQTINQQHQQAMHKRAQMLLKTGEFKPSGRCLR